MTCHPTPTLLKQQQGPRINHELCISSYTIHQEYTATSTGRTSSPPRTVLPIAHSLLNTISSARLIHSSADHRSTLFPCLRSRTLPISSHARKTTSTSCLVCAADRQKRTREEIRGVALGRLWSDRKLHRTEKETHGYATTTTTIGVLSLPNLSNIIRENIGIFAGLYSNIGTIGESRCP